jgi:nucleoid DNA-binding protein
LKEQPLNTTELADAVAEAYDIPKAKAREIVSSIFALIIDAAKKATKSLLAALANFPSRSGPRVKGAIRGQVKP